MFPRNSYALAKRLSYIEYMEFKTPIREALVSAEGFSFYPETLDIRIKPLEFLNETWNENNFNQVNLPRQVGHLTQDQSYAFSFRNEIRILDMPIKFPHSDEFRCPKELEQFEDVIKQIAAYEKAMNPKIDDYYCYITVDQHVVKKGDTTRRGGIHVDGFQGARIKEPLPIDHSYLVYTTAPTVFYNQPFKVASHWNRSCHNYFDGFEAQKDTKNAVTYDPLDILLINAYCLHEAPMVERDMYRTFFRMTYTVREFDRTGNAHNPMFDYQFDMQCRDTAADLVDPNTGVCGVCLDSAKDTKEIFGTISLCSNS